LPVNSQHERFLNRELSWLQFNARVLELAQDREAPPLERLKFLAIFADNLDEFYMVRVGGLRRQVAAGLARRSPDGLTPREQLRLIDDQALELAQEHARLWHEDVRPDLARNGLSILHWKELDEGQRKHLDATFAEIVFPVVTPLAVDPGHPFPYISNLSLNLAVMVRDPRDAQPRFARVKVPPALPRLIHLEDDDVFVPLEDIMAANLDQLFTGMEIVDHRLFRVTRNADMDVDDDGAEDLLEALEEELRQRRFSPAVRLEIGEETSGSILAMLTDELQLGESGIHRLSGLLGLSALWELYNLDRPDLKDIPHTPSVPASLRTPEGSSADIFSAIRSKDVLVHHPYDSFAGSVERFIEEAATDPDVLAIKQTLYRTSGDSAIAEALIEAAENGKQVVVLVEIKARFDERNNIRWVRTLEQAGCHVVYGIVGLKTHAKMCLVVRKEAAGLVRYVHIGTGNYNPKTARLYEDVGFLSSDEDLGEEASRLFNFLTGYTKGSDLSRIMVSPSTTRNRIIALIEREIEAAQEDSGGRIIMKMNSLTDEDIIDSLYRASDAGVEIDLIVRSICALRPGVAGLSERIKVKSILGRFLEHSRIFYFGSDDEVFIGSADMMHRNLDARVEAIVDIPAFEDKEYLKHVLDLCLRDNVGSWTLSPDASWRRIQREADVEAVDVQIELIRETPSLDA
jgi:polyphosphate kinase